MASGDKLQVVLEAQDEISGKIRTVRGNIKTLAAEQARYARETEAGNAEAADSYETVRREILKQKAELVRLGAERSDLTREARRMAEEERRLASVAEQSARKQRTGLLRVTDAARGVVRAYDRVASSMGSTRRASERLETTLSRLDDGADNFQRRWTTAIATVERKMSGFHAKTPGQMGGSGGGAGGVMGGVAAGGIAGGVVGGIAAGAGLVATGGLMKGFQVASQLEQSQLAFEQLMGSAEDAAAMLEWIKQTSKSTPFELTGLTMATQQLMGFGFSAQDAQTNLLTIGDAAAATGKGQEGIDALTRALGQMQAKQKITGEEMMQLTEAGIPAWQLLADEMGTSVSGLMAQSMLPGGGKAIFDAGGLDKLLDGMTKKYGGLMEKQADTMQGAQSNLMDTFATGIADELEGQGITEAVKRVTQWVGEKLPLAFDTLRPLVKDWIGLFREAWPVIRPVLMGIGGLIRYVVIPALRVLFAVIKAALKAIQWVADRVSRIWNGVGDFVRGVLGTISGLFTSWSEGIRHTINTVIGWINKIPGIEMELIQAPGVDGALWAGGAVNAGTYLVGEVGPELFVPNAGSPFMVGQGGMELRDLPGGVMIPNHLLGAVGVPQPSVTVNVPAQGGGDMHIGQIVAADPREAVREMERAQRRRERLLRERV